MTEQELKEVLQGVIDGKELQCKWDATGDWMKVDWGGLINVIAGLHAYAKDSKFRIKPEVKTFKYWTRPCRYHEVLLKTDTLNVWCSNSGVTQENYSRNTEFSKNFQWLAPATAHEVEYE